MWCCGDLDFFDVLVVGVLLGFCMLMLLFVGMCVVMC